MKGNFTILHHQTWLRTNPALSGQGFSPLLVLPTGKQAVAVQAYQGTPFPDPAQQVHPFPGETAVVRVSHGEKIEVFVDDSNSQNR